MADILVSAWTDEELKHEYIAFAARAQTWTDADRKLLEQIILERMKRQQREERIRQIRQIHAQG